MKKEIDRKLLAALRAREPQGLEEAIGRYSPYVAGVLRKVLGQLGTQEDLEELSSDVFVALWQSAEGLREDSDLKLWLGVVARNRALKHLRALRLELPLEDAFLPWRTPSSPARSPPGFGSARRKPSWCARRCCASRPPTGTSSCGTTTGGRRWPASPKSWA